MRYPVHHGRRVRLTDAKGRETTGRVVSFRGTRLVLDLSSADEPDTDQPTAEVTPDFIAWASSRPIGVQVHEARLALGLTQSELGARSGFDDGYVSKIERGLVLPVGNGLVRLARALGIPLVVGPGHPSVQFKANSRRPPRSRYVRRPSDG